MPEIMRSDATQCSLFKAAPGGGRCDVGGGRVEWHHQKFRSHQGGDDAANLAPICPGHHRAMHEGDQLLGKLHQYVRHGCYCYAETKGGEPVWFYWQDIGKDAEDRATDLLQEFELNTIIIRTGAWRAAETLYRMEIEGQLWLLLGFDSIGELAKHVGFAPRTLRAYLAAERTLHENSAITAEQRTALREQSMELMVTARQAIAGMSTDQVAEVIEMAQVSPTKDVAIYAKRIAGGNEARAQGFRHAEVTLTVRAATLVVEVPFIKEEEILQKAKRSIECRPYVHVVDWAPDDQHSWEETGS